MQQLLPFLSFDADEAGFTLLYRFQGEHVMERRDPENGATLWYSFGPPYATVASSGTTVVLPSGRIISMEMPVASVKAFDGCFFVTTRAKTRDIEAALEVRRNVYFFGPDGLLKWRIGEPPGRPPPQYEGVAVDASGGVWALAGTQMFKARIDLETGDVYDLEGYK